MTSISTHINWYKGRATVVTSLLLHGSHSQIFLFSWVIATTITLYDLWNRLTGPTRTFSSLEKNKRPQKRSCMCPDFLLRSPADMASLQLSCKCGKSKARIHCRYLYHYLSYPSDWNWCLCLCFCFSPLPPLSLTGAAELHRKEKRKREEKGLKGCRVKAELLFKPWVERDVKMWAAYQPAVTGRLLLWLCSVCADGAEPVTLPALRKAAPRAVCSQPNPACQISLQVTWLLLSSKHT